MFSGEAFEGLRKRKFALQTRSPKTDLQINLIFDLLMLITEKWNANVSKTILVALDFPELTQVELTAKIGKKQSQISRELKKAGFDEVLKAMDFCQKIINDDATIHS